MRISVYLILALLWAVLALPACAVEYKDGTGIQLSVKASATTVTAGTSVRLTISASDQDFQVDANGRITERINDPVKLLWESSGGRFQRMSAGDNPLSLDWFSPIKPGNYAIFVTADDSGRYADEPSVRQIIEVTVQQVGTRVVPTVRVAANPQTIRLRKGGTSNITAQVLGDDLAGKEVAFFTTRGTLSAARAVSDANGVASVRLTVTQADIGTAIVSASYGQTTSTTTVEIVRDEPGPEPDPQIPGVPLPPPNSQGILVDVNPGTLPADGQSTAVVSVRVTDLRGYGIPQQPVLFRTTMGIINPASISDRYGYARVQLTAAQTPGTAIITADVGAKRGYALATFTPVRRPSTGQPRLFLTLDPNVLPADGMAIARVEALVLDSDGRAAVNTPVTFAASLGTLQQQTVNTGPDGRASTTLRATDRPGIGTVSAIVGGVNAASPITFQGTATGTGISLDLRVWNGQQTGFVAENWLLRQVQMEFGDKSAFAQALQILDDTGKPVKDISLPREAVLIRDQYGVARGYGSPATDGKAAITVLQADGTPLRALSVNLPLGSHLREIAYAEPAGQIVVTMARPDSTVPEVHVFAADGAPLLVLRDGLEKLPAVALGGDGYLAVALPGGTVRTYAPTGLLITELRRTDGLPATAVAIAPKAAWVAVASALPGQTEVPPHLGIYAQGGTLLLEQDLAVTQLAPAGADYVLVSTPERTIAVQLATRRSAWSLPGAFSHFLPVGDRAIIVQPRDAQPNSPNARITVVRLADGQIIASQEFTDLRGVFAIVPANARGHVGVLAMYYTLRFPVPTEK